MKKILLVVYIMIISVMNIYTQDYYWEELILDNYPPRRTNFGMCPIGDEKVIIFGGEGIKSYSSDTLGDTWIFDLKEKKWLEILTEIKPEPRTNHRLMRLNTNKILLYGGKGIDNFLGDTWIFDLDSMEWYQIFPSKSPPLKESYSGSQLAENKVIIFGGNSIIDSTLEKLGDTWIFNYMINSWESVAWKIGSPPPKTRIGGNMVHLSENKIFLTCGRGVCGDLNDNWVFDLYNPDYEKWLQINPTNNITPMSSCAVSEICHNKVILYGGYNNYNRTWLFNSVEENWIILNLSKSPKERHFHQLSKISEKQILLFGQFEDTWLFHYPTTEINENFNNQEISISCSNDNLIIYFNNSYKNDIDIKIYNINGTELLSQNIPSDLSQYKIDISNFTTAVYFVRLYSGKDIFVKKFVKY
jgi:hypothetical protein